VVKNIILAIASMQAVIAAICAIEALKVVTGAGPNIQTNLLSSADNDAYMQHFFFKRKPNCS
jgi:hypothetical protein